MAGNRKKKQTQAQSSQNESTTQQPTDGQSSSKKGNQTATSMEFAVNPSAFAISNDDRVLRVLEDLGKGMQLQLANQQKMLELMEQQADPANSTWWRKPILAIVDDVLRVNKSAEDSDIVKVIRAKAVQQKLNLRNRSVDEIIELAKTDMKTHCRDTLNNWRRSARTAFCKLRKIEDIGGDDAPATAVEIQKIIKSHNKMFTSNTNNIEWIEETINNAIKNLRNANRPTTRKRTESKAELNEKDDLSAPQTHNKRARKEEALDASPISALPPPTPTQDEDETCSAAESGALEEEEETLTGTFSLEALSPEERKAFAKFLDWRKTNKK